MEIKIPAIVDDDTMVDLLSNLKLRARSKISLFLDVTGVQDYDMEAHRILTGWVGANNHRISRIAVLTDHCIWDSFVSVLSAESDVVTRTFPTRDQAIEWLGKASTPRDIPRPGEEEPPK